MNTTFERRYIAANAPGIAINAIRALLWHGTRPAETLERAIEYERRAGYCNPAEMRAAVLDHLHQAASGKAGLYRLVNIDRASLASPCYRTSWEYLRGECGLDTALPAEQISAALARALEGVTPT